MKLEDFVDMLNLERQLVASKIPPNKADVDAMSADAKLEFASRWNAHQDWLWFCDWLWGSTLDDFSVSRHRDAENGEEYGYVVLRGKCPWVTKGYVESQSNNSKISLVVNDDSGAYSLAVRIESLNDPWALNDHHVRGFYEHARANVVQTINSEGQYRWVAPKQCPLCSETLLGQSDHLQAQWKCGTRCEFTGPHFLVQGEVCVQRQRSQLEQQASDEEAKRRTAEVKAVKSMVKSWDFGAKFGAGFKTIEKTDVFSGNNFAAAAQAFAEFTRTSKDKMIIEEVEHAHSTQQRNDEHKTNWAAFKERPWKTECPSCGAMVISKSVNGYEPLVDFKYSCGSFTSTDMQEHEMIRWTQSATCSIGAAEQQRRTQTYGEDMFDEANRRGKYSCESHMQRKDGRSTERMYGRSTKKDDYDVKKDGARVTFDAIRKNMQLFVSNQMKAGWVQIRNGEYYKSASRVSKVTEGLKLFGSVCPHCRTSIDTEQITAWAERRLVFVGFHCSQEYRMGEDCIMHVTSHCSKKPA